MPSRPFLRAVLAGGGVVLLALLAVVGSRWLAGEPEPMRRFDPAEFVRPRPKLDAPYVVTDYHIVDAMLALARVRPEEHVVDLGSGDGRILIAAARSHGAGGLGVDIDPDRVREATANAHAAGVSHRVEFRRQDLFETPLAEADVVTLYLTAEVNRRLRPRLLADMRPGARIVSHDFDMGEWRPDGRQRIGAATLYLWVIPARIEGRWTLSVDGRDHAMTLERRFQEFGGTIAGDGRSVRVEQGRIAGRRIRFVADLGGGRRVFEGRVADGRIEPLSADGGWRAARAG